MINDDIIFSSTIFILSSFCRTIANVSGLDIQVENYADHSDDIR